MATLPAPHCLVLFLFLWFSASCSGASLSFLDTTLSATVIQPGPRNKWGGPCIADLDGDGHYDLILSYHSDARLEIHFGNPNNTFSKLTTFRHRRWDVHGINVAQHSARKSERLIVVSVGGGRGTKPGPPTVYSVNKQREIKDVTEKLGFGGAKGRGRIAVWMDLALRKRNVRIKSGGGPDLLYFSYRGTRGSAIRQLGYRNVGWQFKEKRVPGIEMVMRGRSEVTDVDGDGVMEVVNIRELKIFKLVAGFKFRDVSEKLGIGKLNFGVMTVSAVAEGDFDGDGTWDLFVCRTNRTFISNRKKLPQGDSMNDYLLKNVRGTYVDVARKWGMPEGGHSQGVTVGDFDNDGWLDVLVMRYRQPDIILMNQNGTGFKVVDGLFPKAKNTVGNNAVAFDYDLDGHVDIMLSHGERSDIRGRYILMRNMGMGNGNHWLLVRVLNERGRGWTALHAVVKVGLPGGRVLIRRVGSVGAQGGGGSYLDTVHFGVGKVKKVDWVAVWWGGGRGKREIKRDVGVDRKLTFGVE